VLGTVPAGQQGLAALARPVDSPQMNELCAVPRWGFAHLGFLSEPVLMEQDKASRLLGSDPTLLGP
jgi:hypothetical protein